MIIKKYEEISTHSKPFLIDEYNDVISLNFYPSSSGNAIINFTRKDGSLFQEEINKDTFIEIFDKKLPYNFLIENEYNRYVCTVCHNTINKVFTSESNQYGYCPNCGSKVHTIYEEFEKFKNFLTNKGIHFVERINENDKNQNILITCDKIFTYNLFRNKLISISDSLKKEKSE